ncbi:MAG: GNAT family N-acetyltransferase [Actinobacteria bacterium]|nr:GNAT family N-acetyltransferase [Actinomycetota bacterium]
MVAEPLKLQPFDESDFAPLIAQVPDARFLLQWAGPEYTFPLDPFQLRQTLAKAWGRVPGFKVYKAVLSASSQTVGHIQLMDIDHESGTCVLGRVLIFPEHRGQGLGKALVRAALTEAFRTVGLGKVTLLVFAFNKPAVATYCSLGFVRSLPDPAPHAVGGESWDVLAMELSRERWDELTAGL